MKLIDIVKNNINKTIKSCNVSQGTVKRWIKNNKVPKQYTFELYKLAKIPVDYSHFSPKDKDQFYTDKKTAKYCYQVFQDLVSNDFTFIEPSAGDGSFLPFLDKYIALDIEPKNDNIKKQDFLEWTPPLGKYCCIGNPPFGLRGHLALKFINHSAKFCDYVAFILPQLFESDGKGSPRKRVKGLNLIHSEKINSSFYYPGNKKVKVECIFQIWSKNDKNEKYNILKHNEDLMKIYSLSDGGTPSSTRNKNMLYDCDIYLPSTCFGQKNMKYYTCFDDLPGKKGYGIVFKKNKQASLIKFKNLNWNKIAFLSTNSAYNIRKSQIYNVMN